MRRPRSGLWIAVVFALAGFAPLAWLQYRWTGQLSIAEGERRAADLRVSVARFAEDFDAGIRQMERALLAGLAVRPAGRDLEYWEMRYAAWVSSSPDAAIVKAFYMALDSGLWILDPASGRFRPGAWPRELQPLRARLEILEAALKSGERPQLPPLDPAQPVLFAPRFDPPAFPGRGQGPPPSAIRGWAIVWLDTGFLSANLLPRLGRQYFHPNGAEGYDFQVVTIAPPERTVYSSNASLPAGYFDRPDAVAPLPDPRSVPVFRRPRGPGRPGVLEFAPPREDPELPERGVPLPAADRGPLWRLMVKHRAGSLEAAVAATRFRNLAVSLGILLLMAVSLAVLLIATRRAQHLARLQMDFVAGVSHELRTPLSVICSAADNLADGAIGGEEKVRRYGEVIRGEGRRLSHMVDQIMGFAGFERGRARYELRPADPESLIGRAMAACEADIRAAGCEVAGKIEPGLPPIGADAVSLVHALRNLIDNALVHGGGKWMGIEAARDGACVTIAIADRGPGFDDAESARIFEPFQRGRRAVEDQKRGFGLGLALARRIVEAHSGTLTVSSRPGHGARFTVSLPVWTKDDDGTESPADRG